MQAPLNLSSAIEKALVILAFLPVITLVFPQITSAAHTAQNNGEALVFHDNSKQNPNEQPEEVEASEENPTLTNPCYPHPIGSCNPDANQTQQLTVRAQTPASTVSGYAGREYSKDEVEALIVHYATVYGIDPEAPKCIAWRESGYNQFSKNKSSSASGVFQYLNSTWRATDEGKAGHSVFDADANVKAAVKYMASRGNAQPWVVRSACPAIEKIS